MKRVNYAWQEFWYGFTTESEARKFVDECFDKGWYVERNGNSHFFDLGENYDERYEVRVKKPIKNYVTGW